MLSPHAVRVFPLWILLYWKHQETTRDNRKEQIMKHVFKATKLGWEKEKKGYGLIQRLETILSGPFTIDFAKISRGFYAPPIDIHCNHQRRLNHKIQRNGGVGNERNIRKYV